MRDEAIRDDSQLVKIWREANKPRSKHVGFITCLHCHSASGAEESGIQSSQCIVVRGPTVFNYR